MSEFTDYYKTLSTPDLLEIIENPHNYQQAALLTAQKEVASRNLSKEEMDAANGELNQKREAAKLLLKEKQENSERKIQNVKKVFNLVNPVKDGLSPAQKAIRRIVLIFCFLIVYWLVTEFSTISIFILSFPENPLLSLLYLFPSVLMIMGLYLFWRQKPTGWILLCFCFIYESVPMLYQLFDIAAWKTESTVSFFNAFRPDPIVLLVSLVLYVGTLIMICRKDIKEIFAVNKKKMTNTIAISITISVILFIIQLW